MWIERQPARRLLLVWLVSALVLTLSPFSPWRPTPAHFAWIPPAHHRLGLFDLLANVALFVPLGLFGRAAGARRSAILAAGVVLSLLVESAQTWIVLRQPSTLDLWANGLGTLLGILAPIRLLAACRRTYDRPVLRWALLGLGALTTALLAWRVPRLAQYGPLLPFAASVAGGLVAATLLRPVPAALLAAAGASLACLPLGLSAAAPVCLAGGALGAWPYALRAFAPSLRTVET